MQYFQPQYQIPMQPLSVQMQFQKRTLTNQELQTAAQQHIKDTINSN